MRFWANRTRLFAGSTRRLKSAATGRFRWRSNRVSIRCVRTRVLPRGLNRPKFLTILRLKLSRRKTKKRHNRADLKSKAPALSTAAAALIAGGVYAAVNFRLIGSRTAADDVRTAATDTAGKSATTEKPRTKDTMPRRALSRRKTANGDADERRTEQGDRAVQTSPRTRSRFRARLFRLVRRAQPARRPENERAAEAYRLAEEYAVKALALDPDLVEARISLAMTRYRRTKAVEEAERHFLRAIELDPRQTTARHMYSVMLFEAGRFEDALRESQCRRRDRTAFGRHSNASVGLLYVARPLRRGV